MNKKTKILIVDDKPENLYALEFVLKDMDVEIIKAYSGNEALLKAIEHEFALAIIDIQMPEMDGYELAEIMMEEDTTKNIPIIFLSAIYSDDFHIFKGYKTGIVDFITKPYKPEILLSKVKVFVQLEKQKNRLAELVDDLNKHKDHLQLLAEARSNFLANMSHEIRTPMNAIIGFTGLALKTGLNDKQRDYLTKIKTSSQALLGIINDILDFSKIDAGKLELIKADFMLDDVLDSISDIFCSKISEKGIEIIVSIDPDIPTALIGDSLRLGQIFINLMNNAVKFTSQGEVVISVSLADKGDDSVLLRFSVKDTGIGISEKDLAKLFVPFTQVESTNSRKYGGTGLGLAISKKLTEMMGGEIWAESVPGKGSVFNFTSKFGLQIVKDKGIYSELKDIRVLVVDDNFTLRETMISILKSFNCLPDSALSGEDALQKLTINEKENRAYSIIIIDWMMPDMDGVKLSKTIKENPIFNNIPVIMMTPFGLEEIQLQALKAGVNSFLMKPVKRFLLLDTIITLLGKKSEGRSYREKKAETSDNYIQKFNGLKALLVEDNSINQQIATEILQYEGIIVIIANNGKEAVDLVDKDLFDIVLMDLEMPVMDGYEATRLIRKKNINIKLPIIAMTAHALQGYREKCLEAGMNDYITKPIDSKELFEALDRWIKPEERKIPVVINKISTETLDNKFPKMIAGIDIESGLKRILGNKKIFIKLLYEFHTNFENIAKNIRENFDRGNIRDCQQIAHRIKGVAGNIGANDLHKISSELETAFRKQEIKNINSLLDSFEKKLNLILESISELKKKEILENKDEPADNDDIPVNTSKVKILLDNLSALLEIGDSEAGTILIEIKDCLKGSTFQSYLKQLEEQIDNFNFNEAKKTLLDLENKLMERKS